MKPIRIVLVAVVGLGIPFALRGAPEKAEVQVRLQEPWREGYQGEDVNGKHVIAMWTFDEAVGDEVKVIADVSGNNHSGKLLGAEINPDGKFGACLESFPGWPVIDERHAVMVKNHAALSPGGAFTVEMWIRPGEKMEGYSGAVLLDKKYVSDNDYKFSFGGAKEGDRRMLQVELGFGRKSVTWHSDRTSFETGKWRHVAFTYNGLGTVQFFVDGQYAGGETVDGLGGIAPGTKDLSIGDRYGSNYHGFPGCIDQVRLSSGILEFRPVQIERMSDRGNFLRMEKDAELRFRVTNLQRKALRQSEFAVTVGTQQGERHQLPELASGKFREISFPLDTRMRPDRYQVSAAFSAAGDVAFEVGESFPVSIVARKLPNEFPVVMWGGGLKELDRLKEIGFTHALGGRADYGKIWQAGEPGVPNEEQRLRETRQDLDRALAEGLTFASQSAPAVYLRSNEAYQRVDREGKPFKGQEDVCALFPEIQKFCYNVGVSMAGGYGDLPAYGGALLHTEVRGHSRPCFHKHDLEAFRIASGLEIPAEAHSQRGVDYRKLKDFPKDRVIADDDPIYTYYRWFWKTGDGWNQLNSELDRGLKTSKRSDFWTWYDPAVRVAATYGSGGDVDVLSQWTYSYPDPIRIGLATDELLTMAGGAAIKQDVMKMTQIIWYRSQTAPMPKKGKKGPEWQAAWEREQPEAAFITIPPMQLREAFWTKIARPIKGIMYHGWQSLVPTGTDGAYRYTHPETQYELARLIREVVQPLGPTLKTVPGVKSDIAFYENFASQMYAGRGTYGWNGGWTGDVYHLLMWAGLQPEVVYDETVVEQGLDGYKMLVMPDSDVVTRSVLEKIKAFQAQGGIVIGDANLTPALKPDIVLDLYKRTGLAAVDKAELQARAATLRATLTQGKYEPYLATSNPEVVPYRRRYAETDYVFLVNDHREPGDYVGHHGRVMENGLPSEARVSIRRESGFGYDLVSHQAVAFRREGDQLVLDVELGPGEGKMLMVTPVAIGGVRISPPESAMRGDRKSITIEVTDSDGKVVDAAIPLQIRVEDSEGRKAENSGYWTTEHGKVGVVIDVAPNDREGIWKVTARELASGHSSSVFFRVGEQPDSVNPGKLEKGAGNAVQPKG